MLKAKLTNGSEVRALADSGADSGAGTGAQLARAFRQAVARPRPDREPEDLSTRSGWRWRF